MRRGKRGYSSRLMSKQILRDSLAVRRLLEVKSSELKDVVVAINRVTKVVKGGKNLSFSALVVVGDNHGHAGFGMGKAREVPMAIKKGIEQAKKNLIKLNLKGSTIPHQVLGRYGSARSEEHTSELQSLAYLVCRLLLEKKNRASTTSFTFAC